MPRSATELVNQALGHIGKSERLTSIDDASNAGIQARLHYAQTRDQLLRLCDWSFATGYTTLSKFSYVLGDWRYAYASPADSVKVRRAFRQLSGETSGLYVRDDQPLRFDVAYDPTSRFEAVLADEEIAQVEYTVRVEDAAVFDPLFVDALTFALASKMSGSLTNDRMLQNDMHVKATQALASARTHTMRERNRIARQSVPWLEARTSG